MKTLVITLLLATAAPLQAQFTSHPTTPPRQKVYIEFAAKNLSEDAIHLALSTSKLSWADEREDADLIFHFDRNITKENRQIQGNEINISMSWQVTLSVINKNGKEVWKGNEPLDTTNTRSDSTEESYIAFLRRDAEYKLTKRFMKTL